MLIKCLNTVLYRVFQGWLYKLPNGIINNLVNKIQEISVKYETTLKDIENDIKDASKELSSMLHELDGNEFNMQGLKAFQELLEVK